MGRRGWDCLYVCIHACMYASMFVYLCICMQYACIYLSMFACIIHTYMMHVCTQCFCFIKLHFLFFLNGLVRGPGSPRSATGQNALENYNLTMADSKL